MNQPWHRRSLSLAAVFAVSILLTGVAINLTGLWGIFVGTIASSILASFVVLMIDRAVSGDPFDNVRGELTILKDCHTAGLLEVHADRNRFFYSAEIAALVSATRNLSIVGTSLGFLSENRALFEAVEAAADSGCCVDIVMAHPDSAVVQMRDRGEGWDGQLASRIRSVAARLRTLRSAERNVSLRSFSGEIHNTCIVTDTHLILNPYVFGDRGWMSPVFVFRRGVSAIASFEKQLACMQSHPELGGDA